MIASTTRRLQAIERYKERWEIETLFLSSRARGFDRVQHFSLLATLSAVLLPALEVSLS